MAAELWAIVVISEFVVAVAQTPNADNRPTVDGRTLSTTAWYLVTVGSSLVLTALFVGLFVAVWRGVNWARVATVAVSIVTAILGLLGVFSVPDPEWVQIPNVIGALAAVGVAILLLHAETRPYFLPNNRNDFHG